MPIHHDRSRVQEARVAGLAITLSVAALVLVVVYVVGGYAHRVVVELVVPGASPLPSALGFVAVVGEAMGHAVRDGARFAARSSVARRFG